jgi:hypothetical protein
LPSRLVSATSSLVYPAERVRDPLALGITGRVTAADARMLRTPTAAYEPITCRSSATEWPTAVRCATGTSVVSSAIRW